MIRRIKPQRPGPIGIDFGSRSVKLIQLGSDRTRVIDAVRWDISGDQPREPKQRREQLAIALKKAREGRAFRGRDAVICLSAPELLVQNVRVAKVPSAELDRLVRQEAAARVSYPIEETEVRYFEAADVRQGDSTKREVILLACRRGGLNNMLEVVAEAGLRPAAIDVEPAALLRCYAQQCRRDEDQQQRVMFVHVGGTSAVVVIAKGADPLFIKYIDMSGQQMDEAVARHLGMELAEATALRRHNGDRRVDQQDPEVAASVAEAVRPAIERLAGELSLCARYHSVTFRGQPISRVVLSGGEATASLVEAIAPRLDLKCELGDPLRSHEIAVQTGRRGQWDVATGLALREIGGG